MDVLSILVSLANISVAFLNIYSINQMKAIDPNKLYKNAVGLTLEEKNVEKNKGNKSLTAQLIGNRILIFINIGFIVGVLLIKYKEAIWAILSILS